MPPADPFSLRILVFHHVDGGIARYKVEKGQIRAQEWICRTQGHWYYRRAKISPDGRWLYMLFHEDTVAINLASRKWYWLTRSSQARQQGINGLYDLSWSPNSRHLLGGQAGGGMLPDLVLFTLSPVRVRLLARGNIAGYGWYPDSEAIWYAVKKGARKEEVWYRRHLRQNRPVPLSRQEQDKICNDWDFLPAAHRYNLYLAWEIRSFPYTADITVRVLNHWFADNTPAFVQTRQGEVYRLSPPSTVKYPEVRDISSDKKWALVYSDGGDYYAVHIATNQWELVLRGKVIQQLDDVIRVEFLETARLLTGGVNG
ncbi:MAG: hypothetical protein K6U75_16205 [Firmicutes bacterium]|nr:hypothetical protein [Bacillota bacterium]